MSKNTSPYYSVEPVRDGKTLLPADAVNTAPVVALGLLGGYVTARETGIRPLGGVILAAAGIYSARTWYARKGPLATAGLLGAYVGAFGVSHPAAKKIGAWPAVLSVTAVASGLAALADQ